MTIPWELESAVTPPERVIGYVSVMSEGGVPVLEAKTPTQAAPFYGRSASEREARRAIDSSGLEILAESRLGKSVAGPPGAFEELTGGTLVARERLMRAEAGRQRYVTHLDLQGPNQPKDLGVAVAQSDVSGVEAVLLERPRIPYGVFPSPIPPSTPKFHLRVPGDVRVLLGATSGHRNGHRGADVTVAMVDSGFYRHPFFLARGYNIEPTGVLVPGMNPNGDPVGHGTGEAANIFAAAPEATLRPYRASDAKGALVAAIAGFLRAKADQPDVLTNSWGGDGPFPPPPGTPDAFDRAWSLEIIDAIEQGIVVIFSAGNGQFSIEPQVPGVIAAGGVFANPAMELSASNYTSGYASPWFEGVDVPTVSGVVGERPRAQYLLLPIPAGCEIDVDESSPADGDTPDGTTPRDGWALFSGTSAAAPQLAGVVAMMLGAQPGLTPDAVRQAMMDTAVDVRGGRCHPRFNEPAVVGPDLATGAGLVNASAAVERVLANV